MKQSMMLCLMMALFLAAPEAMAKKDSAKMAEKVAKKESKKAEKEARELEAEAKRRATPHFQGGDMDTFERWVIANLRRDFGPLPPGTPVIVVDVPFYVETDGSTSLIDEDTPSKTQHPRIVREIERVILFSPDWDPGEDMLGNPVRSRQELSLTLKHSHSAPQPTIHPTPRPKPKPAPKPRPRPTGRRR